MTLTSLLPPLATKTRLASGAMARVAGASPTAISVTTVSVAVSRTVTEPESGLTTHTRAPPGPIAIGLLREGLGACACTELELHTTTETKKTQSRRRSRTAMSRPPPERSKPSWGIP